MLVDEMSQYVMYYILMKCYIFNEIIDCYDGGVHRENDIKGRKEKIRHDYIIKIIATRLIR